MKIVVTGSSGFIGTAVVKKLRLLKHEVIELDITSGIDITDFDQFKKIEKFDVLIHLAAKTFVPDSYKFPQKMYHLNVVGTLNALEVCRINNAKMIYTSSYVYGSPKYLPIDENHPTSAFNPYCQSKLLGEILCKSYNRDFGVPVIIFRPFNIYGKGQNDSFLIPLIIKQIKNDRKVSLKDPRPKRDFVYIDDVIEAYIKAINYDKSSYEVFNIGSGTSYSVKEIAQLIINNLNNPVSLQFSDEKRKNEVLDTVANIIKAQDLLNWIPNTDLNFGLKKMISILK